MVNNRRKKDNGSLELNPHSRTAYLVGESNEEIFCERINYETLSLAVSPEVGYIMCWKNDEGIYTHSAVITNKNPLLFSNRRVQGGYAANKDTVSDLEVYYDFHFPEYNFSNQKIEYRIPKKFQKILDEEKGLAREIKQVPLLDEEKEIEKEKGMQNISAANKELITNSYNLLFDLGRKYTNSFNNFQNSFFGGWFIKITQRDQSMQNKLKDNLNNMSEIKSNYEQTRKELIFLGADVSGLPFELNYLETQN